VDRYDFMLTLALSAPIGLAFALWMASPPPPRARAGILFATIWSLVSLLGVNTLAMRMGWWAFPHTDLGLFGVPLEMHLGWAVLWGAIPALASPRARPVYIVAALVAVDLVTMPRLAPALVLGPLWMYGEGSALLATLLPAWLLFRWTRDDTHLAARVALLCASFASIMLIVLPDIILAHTGGSWRVIAERREWLTSLALQLLAIPAALGVSAVQEFAVRGGGTPVPFDAPKRLVTSGAYAYVANPMQLGNSLLLVGVGGLLASWWVAAAGAMSIVYSAGLAAWDEGGDLERRFGAPWRDYRAHVRAWIPRWRPYVPDDRHAVLYVSETCGKCQQVARWFRARGTVALAITPAEHHPSRDLERITYDPGDGTPEVQGIHAVARALEHINFAYAMVAMIARLPVLSTVIQALLDASGAGPQRIVRCELNTVGPRG
jgi:protein-S-isoprenylcysteine O-methyltransferase Ste14